ncbi:MAG TPA: hypothetical protein VHG33_10170 [Woeseiaceae bacterium]|nr:hypothetical protein [Woeseiaceae bacterium]
MSHKNEPSLETLKSESARQRWELFHRAIATAKRSNTSAMQEAERSASSDTDTESEKPETQLSVAR